MQVFIIGANFVNKGAQSMLFTTISAIRQHYPAAKIFFGSPAKKPVLGGKFSFDEVYWSRNLFKVTDEEIETATDPPEWSPAEKILNVLKSSDLIIDVSGFILGSKWGAKISTAYLDDIELARKLGIPIILFPQSFGPFDFGDSQKELDSKIKSAMTYPEKIFARERDGYLSLRKEYGLKNVVMHPDLVLSGEKINPADIYKVVPEISVPKVSQDSCVGVAPNMRSFDKGNSWQTLRIYYEVINFLLNEGKRVYLFRHSAEDLTPCKWLKNLFADDERVTLWENDFSCFEYEEVCQQFDFLIIGRFHGIVHAYRNNVPCLLLGWAVKYLELAQLMYQSQYIFDITAPDIDVRNIFRAIRDMEENLDLNKKILRERLAQVQSCSTCFDDAIKILGNVKEKSK